MRIGTTLVHSVTQRRYTVVGLASSPRAYAWCCVARGGIDFLRDELDALCAAYSIDYNAPAPSVLPATVPPAKCDRYVEHRKKLAELRPGLRTQLEDIIEREEFCALLETQLKAIAAQMPAGAPFDDRPPVEGGTLGVDNVRGVAEKPKPPTFAIQNQYESDDPADSL